MDRPMDNALFVQPERATCIVYQLKEHVYIATRATLPANRIQDRDV